MIKKIRYFVNNDIDLCNDNKPCKFIILIGNNSTGKTYTIENLNKDFKYSAYHGNSCFKYIFLVDKFDSSTSGWEVAPKLSWKPECLYIPSLSKNIQSQTTTNQLNNCSKLIEVIEDLLRKDDEDNDRNKDNESYKKDRYKNFISAFLNDFFGTNKYWIDKNNSSKQITIIKNKELSIKCASSGEIRALSLITYMLTNNVFNNNHNLLLLDEPETFMHPKAQMHLANWFKNSEVNAHDRKGNYQYFIATHSPFIVKSFLEKFKNDTKIIYYSKNIDDKGKMTYNIKAIDKPIYLNSDNISISEINFHVFQIPSNDYFLELYEHLMKKYMNKNNITDISFFDFDKNYLRTKDNELIQYDISSNGNDVEQTSLSRFRHLIAHGGNIGTEKGYKNYCNNVFNSTPITKAFYDEYKNEYMKLLEKKIKKLITCINEFQ